jgi:DNA-binding response OmpR family regulator
MAKEKILIVDDEPDIVETVTIMLQARHYEVITALGGEEGFTKARFERPDLVLLDIMMPDLDGYSVCSKLREDSHTKNIPIIMFSAKGEASSINKSYKMGADSFIVKPFSLAILLDKIGKLINNRSSLRFN